MALLQQALKEAQRTQKKYLKTEWDPSYDSSSGQSVNTRCRTIKRESPAIGRNYQPTNTPFAKFTPATAYHTAHNPRYPDISNYHGKPNENLEQWTAAADTKFARSRANFPTE